MTRVVACVTFAVSFTAAACVEGMDTGEPGLGETVQELSMVSKAAVEQRGGDREWRAVGNGRYRARPGAAGARRSGDAHQ